MESIPSKRCTKCGQEYPATKEFFHAAKDQRYGVSSYCINCKRKVGEEYRRAKGHLPKNHPLIKDGLRRCNLCKEWFPNSSEFFSRDSKSRDGLSCRCSICNRKKAKHWQSNNRDKHNIKSRKYYDGHKGVHDIRVAKRRLLKSGLPNDYTNQDWKTCLEYWGHCCCICGKPVGLWWVLAKEHWIPINDPRPDNPGTVAWNILPMCHSRPGIPNGQASCNNSKGDKDPIAWLVSIMGKKRAAKKMAEIQAFFEWVRTTKG